MITRRVLLAASVVPLIAAASWPGADRLAFRVIRKGDQIGTHILTRTQVSGGFDIHIAVDLAVKFGPIAVFRYSLRGIEQWRGGAVTHVESETDNDGTPDRMRADRDSQGLWVTGSATQRYLAPADALPASHWNENELNGPWINLQDGKLLRPSVANAGASRVALANGQQVSAQHYVLTGEVDLQIWYDDSRRWTALLFNAKDGSEVRYELA